MPKTTYVRDSIDVEPAIDFVGGLPVVIKSQNTRSRRISETYCTRIKKSIQGLLLDWKSVLVQEYITESLARIFVHGGGDRVVAAMRRKARAREFRNYHLNGTVEKVDISEEFEEQAVRAARVLGLNVAGVDLLEGNNGPLVLEVNSSPGLEGMTTGKWRKCCW